MTKCVRFDLQPILITENFFEANLTATIENSIAANSIPENSIADKSMFFYIANQRN